MQVRLPKPSIFSYNDFLQNRVEAITLFGARIIFFDNYSNNFAGFRKHFEELVLYGYIPSRFSTETIKILI